MSGISVGTSRRAIATSLGILKKLMVWIQWESLDPETKRMVYTKLNTMQVETLPIFHTQNCGHVQVSRGHL